MDLRRLRYFVAVAEEGHITRAAARLGMQQPPLSQQIQAMEAELGVSLLVRNPRGVTLTEAGAALAEEARGILLAVDAAMERTRRVARGQAGTLALGFTTSAALHPLVPGAIRAFRQRFGAVTLELHENNAQYLTRAVAQREITVALIRKPVLRPPGIAFVELLHEELLVVLPTGHRLLARGAGRRIALVELAAEPFILVRQPGAPGLYQDVLLACRAAGFEPFVVAEVAHMLTNINLVAAGAGITLVPASMREVNLRQVAYCRLLATPALTAPLTLVHRADDAGPLLANFAAVAREWRESVEV